MEEAPVLADAVLTAQSMRGSFLDGVIKDKPIIFEPVHQWAVPRPVSDMMADLNVAPARVAGCVTSASTWVDADEDGVPANYTITLGCKDQVATGMDGVSRYTLLGTIRISDTDDANPKSGFKMTWAGFAFDRVLTTKIEKSLFVNGSLTLGRADAQQALFQDFTVRAGVKRGDVVHRGALDSAELVIYTPDEASKPYDAGNFRWVGQSKFDYDGTIHRLQTKTDPFLHFQNSCRVAHPGRSGWDSGSVVYTDGSTLRITYSGCDVMTATLDGMPVPL